MAAVPAIIRLSLSRETTVGRCASTGSASIMLNSPKLPAMLSRKHASLKYNPKMKEWMVKDLESLNGVYINDSRLDPCVPTALKQGDRICFGVNLDTNELKYTLTFDQGRPVLKNCATGKQQTHSSQKAPEGSSKDKEPNKGGSKDKESNKGGSKDKEPSGKDSEKETKDITPDLTPPVSPLAPVPRKKQCKRPNMDVESGRSSLSRTGAHQTSTPAKRPPSSMVNPSVVKKPRTLASPFQVINPHTPSPGTQSSPATELRIEDELFPEDHLNEDEDPLAQLFGNVKPESMTLKHLGRDATTIQIQIAKEEMEKEKHKLLSNIEALKSELSAKEQLLVEKQEEEKAKQEKATKSNDSMISSMQEEFTCVICQELFIGAYTLPCAHSFCEWCIKEWMKGKKQRDCPICRKKITSEPVHSLVLDNAISKLVEKLDPEAKAEREEVIKSYTESLKAFTSSKERTATAVVASTTAARATGSGPTSSGVITRSMAGSSATVPIVIASPSRPSRGGPTVITIRDGVISVGEEVADSESDGDMDSGDSTEDSDSYEDGVDGAYYGGYGRCFRCGRYGHWARGCPYY